MCELDALDQDRVLRIGICSGGIALTSSVALCISVTVMTATIIAEEATPRSNK